MHGALLEFGEDFPCYLWIIAMTVMVKFNVTTNKLQFIAQWQ